MKKYLVYVSGAILMMAAFISSCNKINLPTELGNDIIPPVDNINTFDTTLEVETYNSSFDYAVDSGASVYSDDQILGRISNDPIFGKTDARMYFQLYSASPFKNVPGKRIIDSVVLVFNPVTIYGDTAAPQNIEVSEIAPSVNFRSVQFDTIPSYPSPQVIAKRSTGYPYTFSDFATTGVIGNGTVIPYKLKDSVILIRNGDTTTTSGQLRIKLNNAFGERLLGYDSATIVNDTLFRKKFNGFAVRSTSGNGLMAFGGASTLLFVYYRAESTTTSGSYDTTSATFTLGPNVGPATANYIGRDYSGTNIASSLGDNVPDPVVYIANSPGTKTYIKIPALKTLPNSIIHLAELKMESIYDPSDVDFYAPFNMFLDVYDSTTSKFKLPPYTFGVGQSGLVGYDNFYSARTTGQTYYPAQDPSGNPVKEWRFNITRYIQHVITDKIPAYTMRLHAPAAISLPLGDIGASATNTYNIPQSSIYGLPGIGRVRVGGGNNPTQKMRLRIVYSKVPNS